MKYGIYQIRHDSMGEEYLFDRWDRAKEKFSIDDYDEVYNGEVEGNTINGMLEELFEKFNIRHPEDFRGHSLSMSDVVKLSSANKDRYYYCDTFGWVDITDRVARSE